MKVGFDASVLFSSVGGTGVYADRLLSTLIDSRTDWDYFLYVRDQAQADELALRWPAPHAHPTIVAGKPNTWRLQAKLPRQLQSDGIDLYHSLGYFLPLTWKGPKVVTVHDVNVYLQWRSWARPNKVLNWADMALQTPLAARAADRIITDSQFSRDSISRVLRVPPSKVEVIPLAPDPFFDQEPSAEERGEARTLTSGGPLVLFVGILSPQKNLGMLVRAFAASGLAAKGGRLVMAGSDREGYGASLRAEAQRLGVADAVLIPGFISQSLLRALYHEALALVLPSFGEGFGLPVVEAMACGAPVLAANRQSLPEVLGDAGCLFEPDDVATLAKLLKRLDEDSAFRDDLVSRGHARRKGFSWEATASATAAVYDEVLNTRR